MIKYLTDDMSVICTKYNHVGNTPLTLEGKAYWVDAIETGRGEEELDSYRIVCDEQGESDWYYSKNFKIDPQWIRNEKLKNLLKDV